MPSSPRHARTVSALAAITALAAIACSSGDGGSLQGGGDGAGSSGSGSAPASPKPTPTPTRPAAGQLCGSCTGQGQCGAAGNACLRAATGDTFCGQDCSQAACPSGYACAAITGPSGAVAQCVPASGSCTSVPASTGGSGGSGTGGGTGGGGTGGGGTGGGAAGSSDDVQRCVDAINGYRTQSGLAPLNHASDLDAYAQAGSSSDSASGSAHGHFVATQGGGVAYAENEIPGWPEASYGSVANVVTQGTQAMWAEGPGGGHHDNIANPNFHDVGCGITVTTSGAVWVTSDFR